MAGKSSNVDQFSQHMRAVAVQLLGDPNKALSKPDELRFGTHGSLSVDLTRGVYFDHSNPEDNGGVLKLIERETGATVEGGRAVDWLRDNGYYVEDRGAPSYETQHVSSQGDVRPVSRHDRHGNYLPKQVPDHGELTKAYDYDDENGVVRYQAVRFDWDDPGSEKGHAKTFTQRAPDKSRRDGWTYKVQGIEQLPYRLPELLADIKDGAEIFIVEGEGKVDAMRERGIPATCNTGGAGKFPEAIVRYFKGAKVTVIGDADPQAKNPKTGELRFHPDGRPVLPGQDHAKMVGGKLMGTAARVRVIESLPHVPPKGSVDDWFRMGRSAEELYELAQSISKPAEAVPFDSKFKAVGWFDIDAPGEQHEWLIKKILTRSEVSMLAGPSQSGKSFLAIDMALAVARGVDWFGHRSLQGGVMYCASESAVGVRRKRLPAYRKFYGVASEPIPFVLLQKPLDLFGSDEDVDALIEECAHFAREFDHQFGLRLEMITLDTLSSVTPGWDENSSRDVGPVLARAARLRDATGAHVQFVHHLNADGTKARGHTSIFANIENVIIVKKVENSHDADNRIIREGIVTKQKEEVDGDKLQFVLPSIQIGTDAEGDKITSCIVAPPNRGAAGTAPENPNATVIGGPTAVAFKALYELLRDQTVASPAPGDLGLAQGARVVPRKAWSAKYYELARPENFDDLTDNDKATERTALRKRFERARDLLVTKSLVGIRAAREEGEEDIVWATGKPVQGFASPPGTKTKAQRTAEEERLAEEARQRSAQAFADDDGDIGGAL